MAKRILLGALFIVGALFIAIGITSSTRSSVEATGTIVTSIERRAPTGVEILGTYQDAELRLQGTVNTESEGQYSVSLGSDRVIRVRASDSSISRATSKVNEQLSAIQSRIQFLESKVPSEQDRVYIIEVVPAKATTIPASFNLLRLALATLGTLFIGGALLLLLRRR